MNEVIRRAAVDANPLPRQVQSRSLVGKLSAQTAARHFRFWTIAVLGVLVLCLSNGHIESAERPLNVVLILADDLGWADLHCYGGDLHETPHLDRFAKTAMRFTNAYAAAPICSPTRASILTGKHPARLGMTIWHEGAVRKPETNRRLIPATSEANLPLDEVTLAEVLHDADYRTAHVGKWHLGTAEFYPENQGFDLNIGGTLWGAPPTFFYPYRGSFGKEKEHRYVPGLDGGKAGEYLTDRLTDEALTIIERNADRPFFLNFWHHAVHTPVEAKTETISRFRANVTPGMHHQSPEYAAMVASLDESVGRVLQKLDDLKIADRTIVIFTSDNGGFINSWGPLKQVTDNSPLRSGKGSLYEGGIRIPLIVRVPGITAAATECADPVCTTDFFPTLLDVLKIPRGKQNRQFDGVSLVPLLKKPGFHLDRDSLFFHYPHYYATTSPVSAIRMGRWKLLEYFETNSVELYDLENDLGETKDLSKSMPDRAAEMRSRLHAWRESVHARLPRINPDYREPVRPQ